ncbi:Lysine-specific demethylase 2B [Halocaridina rubra]|uniref:Lysine-specific demethylase 2B n=1 Tax=Halocaridina rubra TaxID=373956 RepID=A0AAN8XW98_HALRR
MKGFRSLMKFHTVFLLSCFQPSPPKIWPLCVTVAPEIKGGNIVDVAPPHMPTWEELQARVSRPLVRPMWVIRPNPPPPPSEEDEEDDDDDEDSGSDGESRPPAREPVPLPMNRSVMLPVFQHLSVKDLRIVMQVCRAWAQWAIHPSLWQTVKLTHKKLHAYHLMGIVRRQPNILDLSWSRVTKEQLSWLLARLPQLQELHLEGQSWETVSCLTSPYCPPFAVLNISFCEGLTDATINSLLSPPRTHRPGHRDTTTRLKQLTELRLDGTQVGDEGVRAIVRSLPFLSVLSLSSCQHITELTAALLAHPSSVVSHSLSSLDLRGCHRIAPTCLPSLKCLPVLTKLALHPCSRIPLKALRVWGKYHGYALDSEDILTRAPRPPPDPSAYPLSDSEASSFSRSSSPSTTSEAKRSLSSKANVDIRTENEEKVNKVAPNITEGIPVSLKSEEKITKRDDRLEENPDSPAGNEKKDDKKLSSTLVKKVDEGNECKDEQTTTVLSGCSRVSTRRRSLLQECDSDSSSNKSEAGKASPKQKSKKSSTEASIEKNKPVEQPQTKKLKATLLERHNLSRTSQRITKEKLNSKDTTSDKEEVNSDQNTKKATSTLSLVAQEKGTDFELQIRKTKCNNSNDNNKLTSPTLEGKVSKSLSVEISKSVISSEQNKSGNKHTSSNCKTEGQISTKTAKNPDNGKKKSSTGDGNISKREEKNLKGVPEESSLTDVSKGIFSTSEISRSQNLLPVSDKNKKCSNSPDHSNIKPSLSDEENREDATEPENKKGIDRGEKSSAQDSSNSSQCSKNQKNVIVTSAEVHRADNYDSTLDSDTGNKRSERRLSIRKSKEEQEIKCEEKPEKDEKQNTDTMKEKRRDSKSRDEEMNRITVEDTPSKDPKQNVKRVEDKDKKPSPGKKISLKQQNFHPYSRVKQEKDIITRSTKRLKSEKEMEEKQIEQQHEESFSKMIEKSPDTKKTYKKARDVQDEKMDALSEKTEKELKSPKPVSSRKERESFSGKTTERKDDDRTAKRSRSDAEEYMSKLRRKSHDSDGSNEPSSSELIKREDIGEDKIRSRRRSARDDDGSKGVPEKKSRDDYKDERKADLSVGVIQDSKMADTDCASKLTKKKSEDIDDELIAKKLKDECENGGKSVKKPELIRERSGSRERPERAHRSPRRLSMCQ